MKLRIKYKLAKSERDFLRSQLRDGQRLQKQLHDILSHSLEAIEAMDYATNADRQILKSAILVEFLKVSRQISHSLHS